MRLVRSLTSCSRSSVIWVLTARSWRRAGFDPGLWRAASIALIVALIVLIFLALSWRSDTKRPRMRVPRLAWKLLNTCLAFRSMLTMRASLHYCATPAAQGGGELAVNASRAALGIARKLRATRPLAQGRGTTVRARQSTHSASLRAITARQRQALVRQPLRNPNRFRVNDLCLTRQR